MILCARLPLPFAAVLLAAAAPAQPPPEWEAPIAEASARFGIPAAWIRRVIDAESAGRSTVNGRPIRSRAGAMGLMQLMPDTWRAMRLAHGLGIDPDDPRDNILAGTAYLRAMYEQFGYPGLFAAYNAGPARYAAFRTRGRGLPAETIAYVARVTGQAGVGAVARRNLPRDFADRLIVHRPDERLGIRQPATGARPLPGVFFPLASAPEE